MFTSALLTLLDHANDLKQLPRTGWLLAGVSAPESVADHTCVTALLALALAEVINADWQGAGLEHPLDVGRVARLALIHDLAESVLTDLPKRSAELLGAEVKRAAERAAITRILAGLPCGEAYVDLWCEYDAAASPEARLVKDADKLEMVHQAARYAHRGHANLGEFWEGHHWHFPVSARLLAALQNQVR